MTILPFRVYAYGAAGAAILGAFFWLRSHYIDVGLAEGRQEMAVALAKIAVETAEARQKAVEAVKQEGIAAVALAEKARLRASQAALAYKRRLEAALTGSPDCQEWAGRPVLCPLPGAP